MELADDVEATEEPEWAGPAATAATTTDSLQLFLNEAGRYPLLTAAEEVALAKRDRARRHSARRSG